MTAPQLPATVELEPAINRDLKVDLKILVAFGLIVLLGGGVPVAVRFTYTEIPPFWGAFMRFFPAAVIFWILVLLRKVAVPRGKALLGAALYGVLAVGAPNILNSWSLVKTPASVFQTVAALVPLITLSFAALQGLEKISWRGVLGGALAVGGILVIFNGSMAAGVALSIPHLLAILFGTFFIGEAGVVAKIFQDTPAVATIAIAMSVGALMLFFTSLLAGEQRVLPSTTGVWLAMGYLVLGVAVGLFLLYLYVLSRWTASGTSYAFVLFPIVTVLLATQFAGERITLAFLAGGLLVLGGVWFGALMPTKKKKGYS